MKYKPKQPLRRTIMKSVDSTEFKQVAPQLVEKFHLNPSCASKIIAVLEANSHAPVRPYSSGYCCDYSYGFDNNGLGGIC